MFPFFEVRKEPFVSEEETSSAEPSSPTYSGRFLWDFAFETTRVHDAYEIDIPWVSEFDAFFGGTVFHFGFFAGDDGLDEGDRGRLAE